MRDGRSDCFKSLVFGLRSTVGAAFRRPFASEPPLPPPSNDPFDPWEFGTGAIVAGRYFHQHPVWFLEVADLPALLVMFGVTLQLAKQR